MKKIAVRNLRLCTKDCLCLYVCPVGATDTENSIIDVTKCTGCGLCYTEANGLRGPFMEAGTGLMALLFEA